MTRMEKRAKTCMTSKSMPRPLTTSNRPSEKPRSIDFKKVEQEYIKEKKFMRSVL